MKIKTHKESSGQQPCLSAFPRAANYQTITWHRERYGGKKNRSCLPGGKPGSDPKADGSPKIKTFLATFLCHPHSPFLSACDFLLMGLFEKKSVWDTFCRLELFGTRSADLHCLGHVLQTCTVWDTFGRLALFGTHSADLHCLGHVRQTCTVWDTFGRLAQPRTKNFWRKKRPITCHVRFMNRAHQCINLDGRYLTVVDSKSNFGEMFLNNGRHSSFNSYYFD